MTVFGQLVLGPPGSGKTKYCSIMQEFLASLGRRVFIVNLDPANDRLYYDCQLNIFDLISIEDVMTNLKLGPNGALVYCMEFLEKNIDWLTEGLNKLVKSTTTNSLPAYVVFDLPGQVELYTHHTSVRNIISHLSTKLDYRLCSVNLVDSYYVTDSSKFVSVLLMSLSSMLQIELPHVNILSKMDLIKQYGDLKFNLDYYTDVLDLGYLVESIEAEMNDQNEQDDETNSENQQKQVKSPSNKTFAKFKKLNEKICDLVQDYSLVSFLTLNIQKRKSVLRCVQQIDKANGYLFGHLDDQDLINAYTGDSNINMDDEEDDDEPATTTLDAYDINNQDDDDYF